MGTKGAARRWAVSAASDGGAGELLGEPSRSRLPAAARGTGTEILPPPSRRVLQDSVSAVPGVHEDPPVQGRPAAAAGPGEGEGRPIPCARLRRVRSVPEGPPTCLGTAAARTRGSLATLGAWGCPPTLSPAAFPRAGSIRLWRSKSRRPVPPSDGGLGEPSGPHVAVSACGEVWLPSSWGAVLVVSDVG